MHNVRCSHTLLILMAEGAPGKPGMHVLKAATSENCPLPHELIPHTRNLYAFPGCNSTFWMVGGVGAGPGCLDWRRVNSVMNSDLSVLESAPSIETIYPLCKAEHTHWSHLTKVSEWLHCTWLIHIIYCTVHSINPGENIGIVTLWTSSILPGILCYLYVNSL